MARVARVVVGGLLCALVAAGCSKALPGAVDDGGADDLAPVDDLSVPSDLREPPDLAVPDLVGTCNAAEKLCGTTCIPASGCCDVSECPSAPGNGAWSCSSAHACVLGCQPGYSVCGNACMADPRAIPDGGVPWDAGTLGTCNTGFAGACSAGVYQCNANLVQCAQLVQPSAEKCDGVDNDCDGVADNGNPGGGKSCSTGLLGVCGAGTTTCTGGNLQCTPNVTASAEKCDSLDNDCDGVVDNGNPGGGQFCDTGKLGVCRAGTTQCSSGSILCNQNKTASAEVCDGLDNDCDGVVDNGNPGGGSPCNTGKLGQCAFGVTACGAGGTIVCNQLYAAVPETCDNKDNDCDGVVDNGNPGGGLSCSTGKLGVCAGGTTACISGGVQCLQNTAATPEICDGLDNDCDGVADNGNPGGGGACDTGKLGVCKAGTNVCSGGKILCSQNTAASAELCNGVDDDCDGVIDNGNPGGGQSCSTGKLGVCGAGTTQCSGGSVVCNQNTAASSEVCDGLDNNCDGLVDNNPIINDGFPLTCAAAGQKAYNVAPGTYTDVVGHVGAQGDEYFVVNFTSVPGAGYYYHPKIDMIDAGAGQFAMYVFQSCSSGAECGSTLTTWEMSYPSNPNNCITFGTCADFTPRLTTLIVRATALKSPTTCQSWTIRVSNQ